MRKIVGQVDTSLRRRIQSSDKGGSALKLNEIITGSTGKFALVGMNSQGKTHALSEF